MALPDVAIGTHYAEQRYLYAFAPQFEVQRYIRTQAIASDVDRLPELLAGWQRVQPKVQALQAAEAGLADSIKASQVDASASALLEAIAEDSLFQQSFATLPVSFAMVELEKLVAAQRTVNLAYVDRLAKEIGSNPTISDLIEFCLSPRQTKEPIQHLELGDNVHAFSSPNTDLRYLGAFKKDVVADDLKHAVAGGLPAAAVIGFVGYGASSINVVSFRSRMYLNNGFHRICALRELGVAQAPVVVQRVTNPQLEFPPAIAGIPREYLLATERPALVKDFSDPELTTVVRTKDRLRLVVLNFGTVGQHDVPA